MSDISGADTKWVQLSIEQATVVNLSPYFMYDAYSFQGYDGVPGALCSVFREDLQCSEHLASAGD
jgi:hypothetical protein